MPVKKYSIELSKEERDLLNKIVEENTEPEKVIMRSKILLLSDANTNPKIMPVLDLAEYLGTTHTTIQTTRTEYVNGGLQSALYRKKIEHRQTKYNEDTVVLIKKLIEQGPPDGYKAWSVRLLTREYEKQGIEPKICHKTMGKILKENNISL